MSLSNNIKLLGRNNDGHQEVFVDGHVLEVALSRGGRAVVREDRRPLKSVMHIESDGLLGQKYSLEMVAELEKAAIEATMGIA